MPILNEARDLPAVLLSVSLQTYDHRRLFLIAVDGNSSDESVDVVQRWLSVSDIRGIVANNPKRIIPAALNVGIALADPQSFIVRLDAHTLYDPSYIADIIAAYETADPSVVCIGGGQKPERQRTFGRALAASLLENAMGLGPSDFRTAREPEFVDSAYCGGWRPGVLQMLGGFDERWVANEDAELSARARARGGRILCIPLGSRYRPKQDPWATVRQWGRYGYWRAQTLLRHPGTIRARQAAPPAILVGAAIVALTPVRPLLIVAYAIYAAGVLAFRPKGERLSVTMACCLFFPACQVAYAGGILYGLLTGLPRRRRISEAPSQQTAMPQSSVPCPRAGDLAER